MKFPVYAPRAEALKSADYKKGEEMIKELEARTLALANGQNRRANISLSMLIKPKKGEEFWFKPAEGAGMSFSRQTIDKNGSTGGHDPMLFDRYKWKELPTEPVPIAFLDYDRSLDVFEHSKLTLYTPYIPVDSERVDIINHSAMVERMAFRPFSPTMARLAIVSVLEISDRTTE